MSRTATKPETSSDASFAGRLNAAAAETEQLLDQLLTAAPAEGEIARPPRVTEAMRYSSLAGGKRLRPFLAVETAALFGVKRQHALMAGAAIELVHCYSLVHDDLPAMDDDDMRRGKPSLHKAFDEATAILAGDGLLTLAFGLIASPEAHGDPFVRCELAAKLAAAAGHGGMVGGQMLDISAERSQMELPGITRLARMKTAALFTLRLPFLAQSIPVGLHIGWIAAVLRDSDALLCLFLLIVLARLADAPLRSEQPRSNDRTPGRERPRSPRALHTRAPRR